MRPSVPPRASWRRRASGSASCMVLASANSSNPMRRAGSRDVPSSRAQCHIKPGLGDVDADNHGVHPVPSPRKWASLADQASAQVRWNDGRSTTLPRGPGIPGGFQPFARHRIAMTRPSSYRVSHPETGSGETLCQADA
jgi:hypothetical protein